MSPLGWLVAAIIAVILAQIVLRLVIPKAPKEKMFRCARCGANTLHSDRTMFAWTRGERMFYCDPCNSAWLESCTPAQRAKYDRNMARMERARRRR